MRKIKYPTEQIEIYCADCKKRPNERFCENCNKSKCRECYEQNCLSLKLDAEQNKMLEFIPDCVDKQRVLKLISEANIPIVVKYMDANNLEQIKIYKVLLSAYELTIKNYETIINNYENIIKNNLPNIDGLP